MKSEKFKSLAERRVNNAIKQIRLIGNLAKPNTYEYTDEQVKKICSVLQSELSTMQSKFKSASAGSGEKSFSL